MRIVPLRGFGATWLKCPSCRLACRPAALTPDGGCPRCGHNRMLRLSFSGHRTPKPEDDERTQTG
ncbi:hypothetical protein [Streptomyces acidiscabies]|uniref:Uncharacterized protein n=1 Tax=Streptomyces acidiscabies TaxID=42234 RepID=A0AAP6BLX2_9ACTN|nr:hypothetical protein [Streptomyces acidiscabies]MBP5942174.1 hypothetical protein [Streptomyces sp. LBUM 1476]MBZ3913687.1 hypothetical protein [Streptomyces acidiscabies]MDX2967182.1 hypothetical protein [Streptomyces acidiscabies]MDX3025896.1 hypothetical protein [Streptomyces acidiscabies]MDX3796820.1 hypothetical protein [Streptomyces acidiscabies]